MLGVAPFDYIDESSFNIIFLTFLFIQINLLNFFFLLTLSITLSNNHSFLSYLFSSFPLFLFHVKHTQNVLSTPDLESYDTFELIVQELDLKLEQQTVLASWDFLKDFLQRRHTNEGILCYKVILLYFILFCWSSLFYNHSIKLYQRW